MQTHTGDCNVSAFAPVGLPDGHTLAFISIQIDSSMVPHSDCFMYKVAAMQQKGNRHLMLAQESLLDEHAYIGFISIDQYRFHHGATK
jgi:hypothetical protein